MLSYIFHLNNDVIHNIIHPKNDYVLQLVKIRKKKNFYLLYVLRMAVKTEGLRGSA